MGRYMVYTMNAGPIHGPQWKASADHLASQTPAHVFCGQEINDRIAERFENAGWLRTDPRFLGKGERTEHTPQLMIAAWPSLALSITTLQQQSKSVVHKPSVASHWLTAYVQWRWYMSGQEGLTVTNVHIHRDIVGEDGGQEMQRTFSMLAQDLRSGGVRLVCGDLNKGLLLLAAHME